jgi:hypothetical protein
MDVSARREGSDGQDANHDNSSSLVLTQQHPPHTTSHSPISLAKPERFFVDTYLAAMTLLSDIVLI